MSLFVVKNLQGLSRATFSNNFSTNAACSALRSLAVPLLATLALLAGSLPAAPAMGVTWLSERAPVVAQHQPKVDPGISRAAGSTSSVLVQAAEGALSRARDVLTAAGGTIVTTLPMINGFEAEVTSEALPALEADPSIRSVTANRQVRFEEFSYDATTTASSFARTSGATQAWANGNLGQGIGVAVLDTGISEMKDFGGRIVHGPDLSGEGTTVDTYGHGTVMAGVIGGGGQDSSSRIGGAYTGVAPKSTLVSVKVAGRNAAVDVSTILQGMHWVSAYKDQFNIRVLNLSWGTKSTQSPTIDPLNYAVQRLWKQGIVVVVASGNAGPHAGTVTKPGDDPMVITVGAYDDKQNLDPADDSLSAWSSRGPTPTGLRKPDLLAPGRSLIATRSYGSAVELENPKALLSPSYIKGSGTSEAAAVVSGLAALILQANPSYTPDQVKAVLKNTAAPIAGVSAESQGAGRVQAGAALTAAPGPASWQTSSATGLGSLDASRGGLNVYGDCNGDGVLDPIKGEIDVRCEAWQPQAWIDSPWSGVAWTGVAWTGVAWTGVAWTGVAWTNATWNGVAWTGGTWNGVAWTGVAWTGVAWTGSSWSGVAWTGSSWSGVAWTGSQWTTAEYEFDEFQTAFWGNKPPAGVRLPGEPFTALPDAAAKGSAAREANGR